MILSPLRRAISRCISARPLQSSPIDTPDLDALAGGPIWLLRLQLDTLRRQRAMIDARVDVELSQTLVDVVRPAFAPALDQLGLVPLADLRAEAVLVPIHADLAHRQHDVGVGPRDAVVTDVPMHVEIGNHAEIHELAPNTVAGEIDALASSSRAG